MGQLNSIKNFNNYSDLSTGNHIKVTVDAIKDISIKTGAEMSKISIS